MAMVNPGHGRAGLRFLVAVVAVLLGASPVQAENDRFGLRVVQSGHSLTDPIVPVLKALVASVRGEGGPRGRIVKSTIPGSPMEMRWSQPNQYETDARREIADFDVLVLTERASLSNTMPYHDTLDSAVTWTHHAWAEGNGGQGAATILYATWVDVESGPDWDNPYKDPEGNIPFRERMPLEMARWQEVADHVNANLPEGAPPMKVIPGPLIMAAVHDAIADGRAPGLTRIEDLFSDSIHLNDDGAYLIGLAHLAIIYDVDPRSQRGGMGRLPVPRPETADWMKQLVHEVLLDYPDSDYSGGR